jgi:hypothetical protein
MLDFANDVREMLAKGAGDGTGREGKNGDRTYRQAALAREVFHAAVP